MTSSTNRRSKHCKFYTTTVEDCLFKIPREPLEAESIVFRDMFLLPQGDKDTVEGLSDENPVVLPGVSQDEFEQLLTVLLSRKHVSGRCSESDLDLDQWVSVLKLSTMWEFHAPRIAAIIHIDSLDNMIDPIDKVVLAMQYDIKEWLLPALLKLAQRAESINIEEGRRMGFETALKLASVREKFSQESGRHRCHNCGAKCSTSKCLSVGTRDPATKDLDFAPVIRSTFDL
ncbi:hypothetical protein J3A83DRAFT_3816543 [Scleroderma citrinum]